MVKVLSMKIDSISGEKRSVVVNLVADTQDEVTACGTSGDGIVGLTADDTMAFGSMALCVDGSSGMLDSTGQWKW